MIEALRSLVWFPFPSFLSLLVVSSALLLSVTIEDLETRLEEERAILEKKRKDLMLTSGLKVLENW